MADEQEQKNRRRFDDISWKILGWLMDALALSALAFSVNLHLRITDLELWQAETAGNRWTAPMQAEYAAKQSQEIMKLWSESASMKTDWLREIAAINVKLASLPNSLQTPPKWWEDYVRGQFNDYGQRIKDLENCNRKGIVQ